MEGAYDEAAAVVTIPRRAPTTLEDDPNVVHRARLAGNASVNPSCSPNTEKGAPLERAARRVAARRGRWLALGKRAVRARCGGGSVRDGGCVWGGSRDLKVASFCATEAL